MDSAICFSTLINSIDDILTYLVVSSFIMPLSNNGEGERRKDEKLAQVNRQEARKRTQNRLAQSRHSKTQCTLTNLTLTDGFKEQKSASRKKLYPWSSLYHRLLPLLALAREIQAPAEIHLLPCAMTKMSSKTFLIQINLRLDWTTLMISTL